MSDTRQIPPAKNDRHLQDMHNAFSSHVNDELIEFQDAAYLRGYEVGRTDADKELPESCKRASKAMNDYGNITNWPSEMPNEYPNAINALRAAIARAEPHG
jgi:hypothetical protein